MKPLLLAGMLTCAVAAPLAADPPPLVQLIRRPGVDATAIRRYAEAGAQVNVLGMTSVTGMSETWLLEAHGSFAGIEELDKSLRPLAPLPSADQPPDAPFDQTLAATRSLIAVHRPGLSYRPDQAIQMFPKARYFQISIFRIRPGSEADFADMVKARRFLFDSMNLDRPDIAYQVISGAPSGTYLFLAPLTSLKTFDDGLSRPPTYAEGAVAAAKAGEVSREHLLFRLEPGLSWVSDDFAAPDPEFWHSKGKAQ